MNKNEIEVIACDLDGTLAPSKSNLEDSMATIIRQILQKYKMAVISGGSFVQFERQFLNHIPRGEFLKNLYIFPTNGSNCFIYELTINQWKNLYSENLSEEEKNKITSALKMAMEQSGLDFSDPYGEIIEDRGGQITFSGKGQGAPLKIKEVWDPDEEKRKRIASILQESIPDFEIRIGGATSIDVTRKGIDKAYAMEKIRKILDVSKEKVVFIGDALFPEGNDFSVKKTGVECIEVSGPKETERVLMDFLKH